MDQDTARHIKAIHDELDVLWRHLELRSTADEHRERAERHAEEARQIGQQLEGYKKQLGEHIRNLTEQTSKYVNVVMAIGYTGYFATWSFTKEGLGPDHHMLVGLLGFVSVAIFCLWEMFGVFVRFKALSNLQTLFRNSVSVQDFEALKDDLTSREDRTIAIIRPLHAIVFTVSFGCVAFGGLVMMHSLYTKLAG
ncbi:hypothetical protein GOA80_21750 [Sinorhizobium meliloti]|nr:hypothetical protein [Sinorhizobium meliloti]